MRNRARGLSSSRDIKSKGAFISVGHLGRFVTGPTNIDDDEVPKGKLPIVALTDEVNEEQPPVAIGLLNLDGGELWVTFF